MSPSGGASARPVTPIGIAATTLGALLDELNDADLPAETLERLGKIHLMIAGLDPYLEALTTPASAELQRLAEQTATEDWEQRSASASVHLEQEMVSGHLEGQFLRMMVKVTGARRILEIGMFTGYSALAMAEALPDEGQLVACELDPGVADLARAAFGGSLAGSKIEVRVGPASETLEDLEANDASFDLVFIDADKSGYLGYLEQLLSGGLLAEEGLILVDNTLLQGEPWVSAEPSPPGAAIAAFNKSVAGDDRLEQVLLPLRDGVTLIRRVSHS